MLQTVPAATAIAAKLQPTPGRRGLLVAAEAALTEVRRVSPGINEQAAAIANANQFLFRIGRYTEAVTLIEAQAKLAPPDQANQIARSMELFRTLKRTPFIMPAGTSPKDPVQIVMRATIEDSITPELAASVTSRNAYLTESIYRHNLKQAEQMHGVLQRSAASSGLAESVLADIIFSNMKINSTGDDATGYSLVLESLGSTPELFFAVREGGRYRVVASNNDTQEVGAYALYALDHGQLPLAVSLLNWKRDGTKRSDSDDTLAGALLPRFWKAGTAPADTTPDSPGCTVAACRRAGRRASHVVRGKGACSSHTCHAAL